VDYEIYCRPIALTRTVHPGSCKGIPQKSNSVYNRTYSTVLY